MKRHIMWGLVLMIVTVGMANASELYKWTDKNGTICYSDTNPVVMQQHVFAENVTGVSSVAPDEHQKIGWKLEEVRDVYQLRHRSCYNTYNGLQLQQCVDLARDWYDNEIARLGYKRKLY